MKNTLLAMLTAGFLMFSGVSCVTAPTSTNTAAIPEIPAGAIPEMSVVKEGNYIGMSAREVLKIRGPPTEIGQCQLMLPTAYEDLSAKLMITGDSATWHQDGQDEEHFIHLRLRLCAVYATVVSQRMDVADQKFIEGETIIDMGYTDYILLREVLEAGPEKDGKDGEYILKPGEMEI